MPDTTPQAMRGHRLIQLGMTLFLLGLLVGFGVPMLKNPRMGLSSHLEGVMNGMLLVILGLIWPRLRLPRSAQTVAFWLAVYGTFVNWATTLLAAIWGAGVMMPIAAEGHKGTSTQEAIVSFGLWSLSIAMLIVSVMVLVGLRHGGKDGTMKELV